MALQVTQKPFLATLPAFYPAMYVVKESSVGLYKFAYTLVVEHWNGASYDEVGTFRIPKNSAESGVWDVSRIVQAYIPKRVPQEATTGDVIRDADSAAQYRFTFGSEQAVTPNSAPIANASTILETAVFFGGTRGEGNATAGYNATGAGTLDLTSAEDRALTSYGIREFADSGDDSIRILVRDGDWGCLDFLYDQNTGSSATQMRVRFYANGTLLSTTDYTLSTYASGSSPEDHVLRAFVYPDSLATLASGTDADPTAVVNDGWTRYTVSFIGITPKSQTHTFVRMTDCAADTPVRFMWLNEFGGWDFINFEGRVDKRVDVSRSTFRTARGNWYTANGGTTNFSFDKDSRGDNSLPSDYAETFTVHTGLLRPEQNSAVESLFRSRDVYATQAWASNSNAMYPVHLTGKSHRRKTALYDNLIEYQFEFQYANQPYQVRV